jgi:aspartate aminotransferase
VIGAMKNVQSQSTSNPTSISQVAAEAALNGDQDVLKPMVKAFKERHDYVVAALNHIEGVSCSPADGAFYAFANVEGAIAKMGLKNDLEFSEVLLNTVGVAVVPGSAFGLDGHMRISYATSPAILQDAIARINKAING